MVRLCLNGPEGRVVGWALRQGGVVGVEYVLLIPRMLGGCD